MYPAANLMWLAPSEMQDQLPPNVISDRRYAGYVADVAGLPVPETLTIARDSLVNDPTLGAIVEGRGNERYSIRRTIELETKAKLDY